MLRRPVCRVSRRAEWSSSARLAPSLTALTIRRTLQSSATRLNSAESPDGNKDSAPTSAPVKPKFGSRWGPKTTAPKPAGLSAAEQAMRDSIVAATPPPSPPPPPSQMRWSPSGQQTPTQGSTQGSTQRSTGLSAAEQAMRDRTVPKNQESSPPSQRKWDQSNQQRRPHKPRFGGQRDNQGSGNMRFSKDNPWNQRRPYQEPNPFLDNQPNDNYPRYSARPPREYSDRSPREYSDRPTREYSGRSSEEYSDEPATRSVERRLGDWDCPECQSQVFSRNKACPFCKTPRPEETSPTPRTTRQYGESSPSNFKTSQPSENKGKFRELGKSVLYEMDRDNQRKTDEPTTTEPTAESESTESASENKKNQPAKDPWTWDMSKLAELEAQEQAQQEQAKKFMKGRDGRDGRKGRQMEPEGLDSDFDSEARERLRQDRRRQQKQKAEQKAAKKAEVAPPAPLYLPEFISVGNLADVIGVRPAQFVACMEEMGFEEVTYKDILDAETAGLVAAEYNFEAIFDTGAEDLAAAPEPEDSSNLPPRPPVVTIMGHVDHGKTTILDWLRKSSVAASEHGGITQHIGAFSVNMPGGKAITFLDTPGHSAFLEMRRRGADVTDIVVLVVAADDSVKPQTIEAIKHATSANVPVIVAMSKIDKEGVNPDKVKGDLSAHGVHVEDYGGDVQAIGVSGKTGEGMVELEEAIVALSEMLDHRADTTCNVEGWVIEASTKTHGRVASALIRRGTLRPGDIIVAGTAWARVRTLRNEAGVAIDEATPGMPVEIDGWREQPGAGTEILQAPTEQKAKDVVAYRMERSDTQKMGVDIVAINEARRELTEKRRLEREDEEASKQRAEPSGPKPVNFILKADVDGSVEAVLNSVTAVGNGEVYANIIRSGIGPVSEFDIEHAASAGGRVISFNQVIDPNISRMAEAQGVGIMDYNIIYKLIDEVKALLSEQLAPTVNTRVTGEAVIQEIFNITLKKREKLPIAGSRVRNGMINKAHQVRVLRGDETIYEGTISSLKHVKKDVAEMRKDTECGIAFEGWSDFQPGDHVQCFERSYEKRYL